MSHIRHVRGGYFRPRKPIKYLPPLDPNDIGTRNSLPDWSEIEGRQLRHKMEDYYVRRVDTNTHLQYCTLIDHIGKTLTTDNVDDMKFVARDHVKPRSILYDVYTGEQMLALLEGQHLLAENSLVFLQTLLYYIGRLDIYNTILEFRKQRRKRLMRQGFDLSDDYQVKYPDPHEIALSRDVDQLRRDLKLFPKTKYRRHHDNIHMGVEISILHSKMLGTADKLLEATTIMELVEEEKRNLIKLKRMQELHEIEKAVGLNDRLLARQQRSVTNRIRRLRNSLGLEEPPRRRYPRHPDVMYSLPDVFDSRLARIVTEQKR